MVNLERTLLDKIINRTFLNKRVIGRPLKANYITKEDGVGVLETMYQPRNFAERLFSKFMFGILPYWSKYTYQFHVEKARLAGLRVEDIYENKFFREPYVFWHVFAQNFHPSTLHERVRDVKFYRNPNDLFRGMYVPDWAKSHERYGWDHDVYSRTAWKEAIREFKSEWTPEGHIGQRLENNLLNALRWEHFGKGRSSRFFYNEVPNPQIYRYGGHLDAPEKVLYSFKDADQHSHNPFGVDPNSPQGKEKLVEILEFWRKMAPELFNEVVPELKQYVSKEPNFRRVWHHYR